MYALSKTFKSDNRQL